MIQNVKPKALRVHLPPFWMKVAKGGNQHLLAPFLTIRMPYRSLGRAS